MRRQIMQQITDNLHNMELTGKVDPDIIKLLDKLRTVLRELKDKWLQNKNTDSYYFYQGLRNIELMLDKMQDRFEHAPEKNDNPKVAEDSQILFTVVDELLRLTESNNVNDVMVNRILSKTRDLRNTAYHQNLIEPPNVDDEMIDKDKIGYQFHSIMQNLDIPIDEEPTIDESENSN